MKAQTFHIMLGLLFITTLACGPEFIDQHDRIKITSDSTIHSGPGQQYKVVTNVKAGSELILLESKNDWHRVRLSNGRTGWIFRGVARSIASEKVIITRDTHLRRGPGEDNSAFAIIKKGKTLDARGQSNNWYLVDLLNGQSGWISMKDAQKVSYRKLTTIRKGQIYQLPNKNSEVLFSVEAGTELLQISQQGDYYMISLPAGDTGWIHKNDVNIPKEQLLVVNQRADIKFGSSIEYDRVETVEKGTQLVLLDQKDDWYQVRTPNGNSGWIYKDFVGRTGSAQIFTTTDTTPSYLVTNTECNIRQNSGTNYPVITMVNKGTILVKIGQQGNWYQVRMLDQQIGWIRDDLVDYNASVLITRDNSNIRIGPNSESPVMTMVPKGTLLAIMADQGGWSKVYLPSGEEGWIRQDLLSDSPTQKIVTGDRVNIRKGPGTFYEVLSQVEKDTPVTLIEEQDEWLRVKLPDGTIGWIHKDLVSDSYYPPNSSDRPDYDISYASAASIPTRSNIGYMPTSSVSQKAGVKITTTSAVNLRIGPSTSDNIITLLPAGVSVTQIDKRGEWYEVRTADGILGFAHESGFSAGDSKLYTNQKSNVRFGPSTDYRIVAELPEKTELTKIEQRDNWINVQLANGQKGWIRSDLVDQKTTPTPLPPQKTESVYGTLITNSDAKILQGPAETYATVKAIKTNTQLKTISKYKNWYEVETLGGEKGWIADNFVTEKDTKKIIVIRKSEVYQGSDKQSGIVTIVDVGEFYAPLGQEGEWYRIPVKPGMTGWIAAQDVMTLKYPPVYVNTSTADITKFADEKSNRLAVVKEGIELQPIDETDEWLFVQLPRGDKGWIKKKLVNRQKHPRIIIIKDTDAFEQPTAGSLLKATLIKDDQFLALDFKNNWYKILLRGSEIGWVYSGYAKEITKGSLLVKENSFLRMGPGLEYRTITTVPGGEKAKWLDQKGDWNQVQIASGEIGWIYEQLAKDVTIPEMTAQKNSSVYAGPGTNFAKVGEVVRGGKYAPIDKRPDWYQIRLSAGTDGWVPSDVFSPKKSRVVFTLDKANIRSGPGMHYNIVETVQPAADVTVIGTEGDWYFVQMQDGKRGYIRKDLVFEE